MAALALGMAMALSAPAVAAENADPLVIVGFGDSLMAGYRLAPDESFPAQLEAALAEAGYENVKVQNAGVSGDTTSGGRARLDWAVGPEADAVILELGANDALRGVDPALARDNLTAMIETFQERDLPILLAGMYAPPNLGPDYAAEFDPIFPELAQQYDLIFYPFFLEGVAAEPELNQEDGLHPTAEGIAVMVEGILPKVEELIDAARAQASAAQSPSRAAQ